MSEEDRSLGERLRLLRRERQMSQSDLGGDRFSGSYVSHVEKGRRRLSAEMVAYFAGRLGIDPRRITDAEAPGSAAPHAPARVAESVTALADAQLAFGEHRFPVAARLAESAARRATAAGDDAGAWSLTMLQARSLFEADELHRAAELAMSLVEHPLAVAAPLLQVEALLLACRASRFSGDLAVAVEQGERALHTARASTHLDLQAHAAVFLLGALMEADRSDRAEEICGWLVDHLDRIDSVQVSGLAHWALGNMGWLTGDVEGGLAHQAAAARLLSPHVDLRDWARFRKAAAVLRLQHGHTEGVLELLQQAGDGLRIVGNPSDLTELRLTEARYRLLTGSVEEAAALVGFCLGDTSLDDAPHSRAEAEALLADVEQARGRLVESGQACLRSALLFEQAGAYQRSVEMWRRHAHVLDVSIG
ncbi:helix-turn-helix domain-containing protein [Auraticoccus monumenti]|uniref:helix-turn-helix domain-containing protein n=1 Tax=Auraticoccus monumenti TaxID=675864 RepID=UPI001561AB93|nr:helix-turn-helix domain-containing protein [Auraticoccus monumenti]